jgi:hypothetical protein
MGDTVAENQKDIPIVPRETFYSDTHVILKLPRLQPKINIA